ncbi:MAG: glycosyltransferase family 4 protein [Acidobacteriia bacterium]|nr:glycosyltransferase family 4 protein [Terriglobia bacterium]
MSGPPGPIRVLVLATKPPFPAVGGGNMTLDALLRALPARDVEVRVLALALRAGPERATAYAIRPVIVSWYRRFMGSLVCARALPLPVARYHSPGFLPPLADELRAFAPHVIHLEQPHLGWLLPEVGNRYPVVLRAQNVESRVLARLADVRAGFVSWLLRREARRMARFEAEVCRQADVVAAISEVDARRLAELAPSARVVHLPAAWGRALTSPNGNLAGERPFLCLGTFDWSPNRDGARWLVRDVWPRLVRREPGATLHLAGPGSTHLGSTSDRRISCHGRVDDVGPLYDPRSVALIPLRAGSGVRLRLLEAWWAGVPAVVTPAAAEGLLDGDADGACVAGTAEEFSAMAVRLATDQPLRERVVTAGRRRLLAHEAGRVARLARDVYLEAIDRAAHRFRTQSHGAGDPSNGLRPRSTSRQ